MMDYKNLFADERKKREMAEYIVHVLKVTISVQYELINHSFYSVHGS